MAEFLKVSLCVFKAIRMEIKALFPHPRFLLRYDFQERRKEQSK